MKGCDMREKSARAANAARTPRRPRFVGALLGAVMVPFAGPALAEVDLRVESRPGSGPVEVFVTVTGGDGLPVPGLNRSDFAVRLDGQPVDAHGFRLPVDQDPAQGLSVLFVQADSRHIFAVAPFIERMSPNDHVAVVRARYLAGDPTPTLTAESFRRVGDAGVRQSLLDFLTLQPIEASVVRYGSMIPHDAAFRLGLAQVASAAADLPGGPRAIVLAGNGLYLESGASLDDIVAQVNALGWPVFTIATEDLAYRPVAAAYLSSLAAATGGRLLEGLTPASIEKSYEAVEQLLVSAYQMEIAAGVVTDCNAHVLDVSVRDQSASAQFVSCDTTPAPFAFDARDQVAPASTVVSNTGTITGIETPVSIAVQGGEYSPGCGSVFTSEPGIARPGDLACVRHVAAAEPATPTETVLVVGGVAASFVSTTQAASPPPAPNPPPTSTGGDGGGGGGGAEFLVLCGLLAGLRRRQRPVVRARRVRHLPA
jgi:hypothetical protein